MPEELDLADWEEEALEAAWDSLSETFAETQPGIEEFAAGTCLPGQTQKATGCMPATRDPAAPKEDKPEDATGPALSPEEDYAKNGTKAKAFKEWFGDWEKDPAGASKVVNPKTGEPKETLGTGQPVKVHHGTQADFDAFDPAKAGQNAAHVGPGLYFSEDPAIAKQFAGAKGKVIESYLNIKRPLDLDSKVDTAAIDQWSAALKADNPKFKAEVFKKSLAERADYEERSLNAFDVWKEASTWSGRDGANRAARALGHDGITHLSIDSGGTPARAGESSKFGRVWIAFEPNQIKAVKNKGTFNPKSNKLDAAELED